MMMTGGSSFLRADAKKYIKIGKMSRESRKKTAKVLKNQGEVIDRAMNFMIYYKM